MFLGGADSNACADKIRLPSFKGVLRFWWRALNWGRIYQACQQDKNKALECLHREEGLLFGHGAGGEDKKGCQAAFRLRISGDTSRKGKTVIRGINYLLGQGLTSKNKPEGYLESGTDFIVTCYQGKGISENQLEQLEQALLCLGLLGGLGARSRKGLGSLSIQELSGGMHAAPRDKEEFIAAINRLLAGAHRVTAEPPYSAFSSQSRIDISAGKKSAMDLLCEYDGTLHGYRTWQTEKPNFEDDHDWAYSVANGKQVEVLPRRAVFGLPHNYFLSKAGEKVDVNASSGRRATPLLAHVHQFENGTCLLVQSLLRSDFLHDKETVNVSSGRASKTIQLPANVNWSVLHQFMNQFRERETIHGQ
nr:type III-B CRISPR module RAMP protein Cmr1 [Endozoicomonas sp.]